MKRIGFITLVLWLVCGSLAVSSQNLYRFQKRYASHSLKFLAVGVYCDREPITNLDWREYLFWLERIYGKDSEEYKAAMPDAGIAKQQLPDSIAVCYFRSPAYDKFPVLGVAPDQARAYCRWRTDRLAEGTLVRLRKIDYDEQQNRDNFFTLEQSPWRQKMKFFYFDLMSNTAETRYGFRCAAELH